MLDKIEFQHKIFTKFCSFLRLKMMYLWVRHKKKYENNIIFFTSLKSLKKGAGSGSISQGYGSGDPDPHQNVTDPQQVVRRAPDPVPLNCRIQNRKAYLDRRCDGGEEGRLKLRQLQVVEYCIRK